ncbi:MAG TPA: Na+/H+ antiporter NhaA [Thermoleophilaceae bacterium]
MSDQSSRSYTGRTAWARNLAAPVRDFLGTESGGAAVLLAATVAALLWANSPWDSSYESVWTTTMSIQVGDHGIALDLREWVNKGLMTFFFLVVGLEAKRELDLGALRERRRAWLSLVTALVGMTAPVLYLAINAGGDGAHGWGAAMSTDTAFALGALALVAPRATRLRLRLLTVVVFDDLIALVVIATVYTGDISFVPLALAAAFLAAIVALRFAPPEWRIQAAVLLGVGVWVSLYESGVDPVIAGLAVGLVTSAYPPVRTDLERVTELTRTFREQPTPELARSAQLGVASAISANERLQYRLHPWTSFVIVPVFALANVGIQLDGDLLADAAGSPITWGIIAGYVLGKPIGIMAGAWLGSRPWLGGAQRSLSWPVILGAGAVGGLGFTVSILISTLAFDGRDLEEAKIGVLAAALLAALLSWVVFRVIAMLPGEVRARQVAGTADDLLDLADDVDPARDHIRGSDEAVVTLLEYGDYECPYCGQAEIAIREVLESFGDELRYVWRHLPLQDVHPNAQMAAEAAEAAAAQGAFWEMHDRLLQNQDQLSARDLWRHAQELGLDADRFWDELKRHVHEERVGDDVTSADSSDVAGTPTFFINGRRHYGAYDVDTLSAAVRAARARERARARVAQEA